MRISDVHNVTGIPLTTLKDLRHRKILELATGGWPDDPDEIRRWGSFSADSVIIIMGGNEIRRTYGFGWNEAIEFSKLALDTIKMSLTSATYADLAHIDQEIWVGRFDFEAEEEHMRAGWNYFSGQIDQLPSNLLRILGRIEDKTRWRLETFGERPPSQRNQVKSCILMNATKLAKDFYQRANETGAIRSWEDR